MAVPDGDHGRGGPPPGGGSGTSPAGPGGEAPLPLSGAGFAAPDGWHALRALTPARIALGRAGGSLPTREVLRFGWDHARARDAVAHPFDGGALARRIDAIGGFKAGAVQVESRAADRPTYLMRPDLGRRLDERSLAAIREVSAPSDLALVVGDGLSALAVERHAAPVIERIVRGLPAGWTLAPVVIARNARVALGDEIGEALGATLVAILLGERPGLSSPDSLGIYLTWRPRVGRTDAERNCISNIRPEGLGYDEAARSFLWLVGEARRQGVTGIGLGLAR